MDTDLEALTLPLPLFDNECCWWNVCSGVHACTNSFVDALIVPQAAYSSTSLCITMDNIRQIMRSFGELDSLSWELSSSEFDGSGQGPDWRNARLSPLHVLSIFPLWAIKPARLVEPTMLYEYRIVSRMHSLHVLITINSFTHTPELAIIWKQAAVGVAS